MLKTYLKSIDGLTPDVGMHFGMAAAGQAPAEPSNSVVLDNTLKPSF